MQDVEDQKRIVLVDDDPIVGEIVSETLSAAGFRVDVVSDGRDALDAIYAEETDLVILDCNLPGRPGMVLLADIRQSVILKSVPILMLTSRTSQWHAQIALDNGANAYLKKPFDRTDLIVVVTKLLSGLGIVQRAI